MQSLSYKSFKELNSKRMFYFHMAFFAMLVVDIKLAVSGSASPIFTMLSFGYMVYAFMTCRTYDVKAREMMNELSKSGVSVDEGSSIKETVPSFYSFVRMSPFTYPSYVESSLGIWVIAFYMYRSNAIVPSSAIGWLYFLLPFIIASLLPLFTMYSLHAKNEKIREYIFGSYKLIKPFVVISLFIGATSIITILIHVLYRYLFDPNLKIGDNIFVGQFDFHVVLYFTFVSPMIFEGLKVRMALNNEKRSKKLERTD